jgi:hypothetical protein
MEEHLFVESRRSARAMTGGITRGQLRGPSFERRSRGLYRPSGVDMDPATERLADVVGLLTPGCVVGGWAALHAQGNPWFDGRDREDALRPALVHCLPGAQLRRRRDGLVLPFRGLLHPDEVVDLDGWIATTLSRATFDEMRMAASPREAAVILDMATTTVAGVPHTSPAAVRHVLDSHHKVRGLVRARQALALGSTRSASPWETRTRLVAQLDVGLSGLLVNVPVFDLMGNLLGVADLLDEESGLVIETDGAHHREIEKHAEDNHREEAFERTGLVVTRVTSGDHGDRLSVVRRLNAALRDARRSTRRDWTLQQPDWWSRSSVARRYR